MEPVYRTLGLPEGRVLGPDEMAVMSSDPWKDYWEPLTDRDFPSEKPDSDIFPVRRSRKLRGWYQLRQWPPVPLHSVCVGETAPRISGGDIPIELIERIMSLLAVNTHPGYRLSMDKRGIGACSLVCRSWTSICQKKIFESLTLRSADDVHQVLELLRAPNSRIGEYIKDIHIETQSLTSPPWIHNLAPVWRLLSHLPRQLEYYRNLDRPTSVTIRGPCPKRLGPIRSIHQALPRHPRMFSRSIQRLHLCNIAFRKFDDLAHLVGEMLCLTYLDCERLTISGSTPTPPARLGAVPETRMTQCDYSWASMYLYTNHRPVWSRWQERIAAEELSRICTLTSLIAAGFEGPTYNTPTLETSCRTRASPSEDHRTNYSTCASLPALLSYLHILLSNSHYPKICLVICAIHDVCDQGKRCTDDHPKQ